MTPDLDRISERELLLGAVNVAQGAWVVGSDRILRTVLGSCVAVCLYDPEAGVGGMNHYVYPPRADGRGGRFNNTTLAADICMEGLFQAMLKAGASKQRMRAKAFGGGRMFTHQDIFSVGKRNTSFAKYWLASAEIPLELFDFHGNVARRLIFHPRSGHHRCYRLGLDFPSAASGAGREGPG